jgi:hypothetical protein
MKKKFLDLTKDPIVIGGLKKEQIQKYLDQGYSLNELSKDTLARVQFIQDGVFYYQTGWVKKGEKILILDEHNAILVACGNTIVVWPVVNIE